MKVKINSIFIRLGLKYGSLGALFSILMFFVFILMDKIPMISVRLFDFILVPVFVFIIVKEFKDYHNNHELRFWQGMTLGFFSTFFLSLIFSTFLWIFLSTFGTELFDEFVNFEIDKIAQNESMIKEQMGNETYEKLLSSMQMTKVYHIALDDLIKKILVGLFISPVISIFMRTNQVK